MSAVSVRLRPSSRLASHASRRVDLGRDATTGARRILKQTAQNRGIVPSRRRSLLGFLRSLLGFLRFDVLLRHSCLILGLRNDLDTTVPHMRCPKHLSLFFIEMRDESLFGSAMPAPSETVDMADAGIRTRGRSESEGMPNF